MANAPNSPTWRELYQAARDEVIRLRALHNDIYETSYKLPFASDRHVLHIRAQAARGCHDERDNP